MMRRAGLSRHTHLIIGHFGSVILNNFLPSSVNIISTSARYLTHPEISNYPTQFYPTYSTTCYIHPQRFVFEQSDTSELEMPNALGIFANYASFKAVCENTIPCCENLQQPIKSPKWESPRLVDVVACSSNNLHQGAVHWKRIAISSADFKEPQVWKASKTVSTAAKIQLEKLKVQLEKLEIQLERLKIQLKKLILLGGRQSPGAGAPAE